MNRNRELLRKDTSGFTLVELLVVVVVIVTLAGIGTPIYLNQRAKAQDATAQAEIAKVSRYLGQAASVGYALQAGPVPSTVPGLGALDAPLSTVRVDPDSSIRFCIRTVSETGNVYYWETGLGRTSPPFRLLQWPR